MPERELADLIYRYGEERASRRIARAIVLALKPPDDPAARGIVLRLRETAGRSGPITIGTGRLAISNLFHNLLVFIFDLLFVE